MNRPSLLIPTMFGKVILLTACSVLLSHAGVGQDKEVPETAREKEEDKEPAEEAPLFVVPDGTSAELFAFITKIKQTRPTDRTPAGSKTHLKLQVEAVLNTCQKIMDGQPDEATEVKVIKEKLGALSELVRVDPSAAAAETKSLMDALESDERPAIVKLLIERKLADKGRGISRMSDEERAAFIAELSTAIDENGVDRTMYSTASSAARALGAKDPDAAAVFYERLAAAMESAEDEAIQSRAQKAYGAARRMRLPGNLMEITGTTAEGEQFDWDAYRGKVVLVDFWASWCGPCRREIPNMKAQLKNYEQKGFAIVGVNLDTQKDRYQKYVDDQELTWTNLMSDKKEEMGWDNPLASYYGISGIPTAILVDKEGKVVSMRARGTELNRVLEELLGPVETEASKDDADAKDPDSEKAE